MLLCCRRCIIVVLTACPKVAGTNQWMHLIYIVNQPALAALTAASSPHSSTSHHSTLQIVQISFQTEVITLTMKLCFYVAVSLLGAVVCLQNVCQWTRAPADAPEHEAARFKTDNRTKRVFSWSFEGRGGGGMDTLTHFPRTACACVHMCVWVCVLSQCIFMEMIEYDSCFIGTGGAALVLLYLGH